MLGSLITATVGAILLIALLRVIKRAWQVSTSLEDYVRAMTNN